ncbi:N-acetylmuramoyl-L-alanine amidase family protein [Luteolibacter luteus]|uniref:N-acetylmuramoyl-L-alanine amidase n=1 Tax=Luteolibacter luteus TaxID=2728835 RepID=A0A858RG15_9BACT|nr:N-acetylmuramoyl-L-alanine amidase [Luteolibacter luteus]QJE95787.1 hypothetical protein HHL09_08305 [Luteolibacter luteus]
MKAVAVLIAFVSLPLARTGFALDGAPPISSVPEAAKDEDAKPAPETNPNWQPVAINGGEYVSAASIARFYQLRPPVIVEDEGRLENDKVVVKLTVGSDEILINGVKFKCTTKVLRHEGKVMVSRMDLAKVFDPVLRPGSIETPKREIRTVVIDPVLGGDSFGQRNGKGTEAGFAFEIADELKTELEGKGFKVELTRAEGENPDTAERVDRVRKFGEDCIVISVGFSADENQRGIRTRVIAPVGVPGIEAPLTESDDTAVSGNAHENLSIALATSIHSSVVRRLGGNIEDLGIVRSRLPLLKQLDSPAVFVECGSMADAYDSRLIETGAYRSAIVRGLSEAVVRYRAATKK